MSVTCSLTAAGVGSSSSSASGKWDDAESEGELVLPALLRGLFVPGVTACSPDAKTAVWGVELRGFPCHGCKVVAMVSCTTAVHLSECSWISDCWSQDAERLKWKPCYLNREHPIARTSIMSTDSSAQSISDNWRRRRRKKIHPLHSPSRLPLT